MNKTVRTTYGPYPLLVCSRSRLSSIAWLILISLFAACDSEKEEVKPNIILILADDLGYGDPEFMNPNSRIPTPNLNRMADEGLVFTRAHAAASVCTPTRYSMLTGRYPWRSRLKKGVLWIWDPPLISEKEFTLGEMLQHQGYHTACIGKWHLGWHWPSRDGIPASMENEGRNVDYTRKIEGGPLDCGFHYYFGDDVPGFPPHAFIENESMLEIPERWHTGNPWTAGAMAMNWTYEDLLPTLFKKAEEYIRTRNSEDSNTPFFLFLSLNAPHTPIAPLSEFIGQSEAGRYGDFVTQTDHSIGEVFSVLTELDIDRKTLVLFTSDNGAVPFDGEKYTGQFGSLYTTGHNPNGELRGIKSDAWEGGHRIPFIARWPGKIEPGKSDALLSLTDLMASFADLTGFQLADSLAVDSYSILPLLISEKSGPRESLVTQSGNGILSYQKEHWKLIMSSGSGGSWSKPGGELPIVSEKGDSVYWKNIQLYDLDRDPGENNNLAEIKPEIAMELASELAQLIIRGRSTPGPALSNDHPGDWDEIKWIYKLF